MMWRAQRLLSFSLRAGRHWQPAGRQNLLRHLHTTQTLRGYKLGNNVQDCYKLLNLAEGCSYEELRASFLALAKKYHPDSGTTTADPNKFTQIKEAYHAVKKNMQEKGKKVEDDDDAAEVMEWDIKHTAPQHRQYLTFEGVGFGTPSQRQRQYQQFKVNRASENIYEYRTNKMSAKYESSLVVKDKRATRRNVVRVGMDRLVEDLIQEAMARGDFDDLPGKGKKLEKSEYNPMVDSFTHNLNRILINNGYAPEWVVLEKEIREGIQGARKTLLENRGRLGKEPLNPTNKRRWDKYESEFCDTVNTINAKINKLNLLVPSLQQQMVPYNINKQINRVLEEYKSLEHTGYFDKANFQTQHVYYQPEDVHSTARLRDVWLELKSLLTFR